ncbi:FeoA family protein [Limibacter armeniacum]|uniref:FeoA family protein n=1 Tax=Limibacter armeniacum TaxID=466084 RepID=UPI002FE50B54
MNMITYRSIANLRAGEKSTIVGFADDNIASKLIEMGLFPGSDVTMVRKAPFGGVFYLKVAGNNFAIRKEEANCIKIKE